MIVRDPSGLYREVPDPGENDDEEVPDPKDTKKEKK